jgi:superkiller protein 3
VNQSVRNSIINHVFRWHQAKVAALVNFDFGPYPNFYRSAATFGFSLPVFPCHPNASSQPRLSAEAFQLRPFWWHFSFAGEGPAVGPVMAFGLRRDAWERWKSSFGGWLRFQASPKPPRRPVWRKRLSPTSWLKDKFKSSNLELIGKGWTIGKEIVKGMFFVVIVWSIYHEASKKVFILDPFDVPPKQFEEVEMNAQSVRDSILEGIGRLKAEVRLRRTQQIILPLELPDFKVPDTDISYKVFVGWAQKLLHNEPVHLGGRVRHHRTDFSTPTNLHVFDITFRASPEDPIRQNPLQTFDAKDPATLEMFLAKGVLRQVSPYLLAVYVFSKENDPNTALAMIDESMRAGKDVSLCHSLRGVILDSKGKFKEAIREYQKMNDSPVTRNINWGTTLFHLHNYPNAISHFEEALRLNPRSVAAYNNLAAVRIELNEIDEAIRLLEIAKEISPRDAEIYNNLGAAKLKQNKSEAFDLLRKAIELDAGYAKPHVNLGIALEAQGNHVEAMKHYLKAVELDPGYAPGHYELGLALDKQDKYLEAVPHYEKAIQIDSGYAAACYKLAAVLDRLGKHSQAIGFYKKAIEINDTNTRSYGPLGLALSRRHQADEAENIFKKAVHMDPASAEIYTYWGIAKTEQGKLAEAEQHFRKAVEVDPRFARAYLNLARLKVQTDKFGEADEFFGKAAQLMMPDPSEVWVSWGDAMAKHGKPDAAFGFYQKAIAANPKSPEVYFHWTDILYRQNRFEEAIALLTRMRKVMPEVNDHRQLAEVYLKWGTQSVAVGNLEEALSRFKKSVEADPQFKNAYFAWALAEAQQGHSEEERRLISKAIALEPHREEGYVVFGRALMDQGKYEEAIYFFSKASKEDPKSTDAYYYGGLAEAAQEHLQEEIKQFEKVVAISSNRAQAYAILAWDLTKQKEYREAEDFLDRALAIDAHNSQAYYNMGALRFKQGQFEESFEFYQKAIHFRPLYAAAYSELGVIRSRENRFDEAMNYFKEAIRIDPKFFAPYISLGSILKRIDQRSKGLWYQHKGEELRRQYLELPPPPHFGAHEK